MAKGRKAEPDKPTKSPESAPTATLEEEDEFLDNGELPGDDAATTEPEAPAPKAEDDPSNEGRDDDEHQDPKAGDTPADPADEAPADDDWAKRRNALWDRAETWMRPAEQPAAPAPGQERKPEDAKDPQYALSADAQAQIDEAKKDVGENDPAFKHIKASIERADRAQWEAGQLKAARDRDTQAAQKAKQEADEAAASQVMQNVGQAMTQAAGKHYESVLGKIGAWDHKAKTYRDSTPAQNQVLGRLYSAANFYYTQAQKAGDPISEQDAMKMGLDHMVARDPAFKAIRDKQAAMEQRNRQITTPPSRSRGAGTNAKGPSTDRAVEALRNWRSKNPAEADEDI